MSSYTMIPTGKLARLIGAILALALLLDHPAYAADDATSGRKTIMFVCLHGSVKSQMAAAHFNRIAKERGLPYTAISRGIAVDGSIPTRIRDGLSMDGLEPTDPRPLTDAEAVAAAKVFAFDPVPEERKGEAEVNYWSDVPPATKDYVAARDVIVSHIEQLVPDLAKQARAQQMLRGVVRGVDERNDRITVRLISDITEDFRVLDGLIFNAVHNGDKVELTVENIDGSKTVVGLRKE
jgi:protein-tyrosine-phosphatase